MTDIHSHILYDVDDGAKSILDSIEIIKKMKSVGFNNLILTPHFINGSRYSNDRLDNISRIKKIREHLMDNNIDINVFLGNEIFICKDIYDLVKKNIISTLNNSRYILIELPFDSQINNLYDIIYELKYQGFIPIIAHPERYTYFQKDYGLVNQLYNEGVLFQSNYLSIIGYYGTDAKNLLRYMLKNNLISYLASDIHSVNKTPFFEKFTLIENEIIKIMIFVLRIRER